MSRQTSRGESPVAVVCEAFGISRAAWYAAARCLALTLLAGVAVACGGGADDATAAEAGAVEGSGDRPAQVLADERFGWCNGSGYALHPSEADWCDLEPRPECPGWPSACRADRAWIIDDFAGSGEAVPAGGSGEEVVDGGVQLRRGDGDVGERLHRWFNYDFGDWSLPRLPPWIGWLAVAVIAAIFVWIASRVTGLERAGRRYVRGDGTDAGAAELEVAEPIELLRRPVPELFARARAAAERGDFAQAVLELRTALILLAEGRHWLVVDPAMTHGDYLRQLRGRSEASRAARALFRAADAVVFGGSASSADEFERLWAATRALDGEAA
jgi:hypothetical protein